MHEARPPLPGELEQRILRMLEEDPDRCEELLEALCKDQPAHADEIRRRLSAMSSMRGRLDAELLAVDNGEGGLERLGDFRMLRRLGSGGMGVVYLARQESLGRRVALKLIRPGMLEQPRARERFQREMRAASGLDHPNICTVYEAGEIDDQPYIAMQYVEGEPVDRWIADVHESGSGTTTRREVLAVTARFEKLAHALHHAHERGVLHRDVKPGNILMTEDGNPVLLDFGLARFDEATDASLTVTGDTLGTPAYMSPEQVSPAGRKIDRRTDVYSLGAALYHALAGRPPFTGATSYDLSRSILHDDPTPLEKLNRSVPPDLGIVVATAMEKDRNRRYRTAEDLAEDLRRLRTFEPIRARRAGPLLRARRWVQRHPLVSALVSVLVIAIAGVSWVLGLAESRLHDFNALAMVEKLRSLEQQRQLLRPAGPAMTTALRDWVEEAEALVREVPRIEAAVTALRRAAIPWTDEEIADQRQEHPDREQWLRASRKADALRRAQEVRDGKARPPEFELGPAHRNMVAIQLVKAARSLLDENDATRLWGREAEALAFARLARDKTETDEESEFASVILAWALHANGLDDEALELMQQAVAEAPPDRAGRVREELEKLRDLIANADEALQEAEAERDRLRSVLAGWRLENEADQFLHDTLTSLLEQLRAFTAEDGPLVQMRARLAWSECVRELTIARHADRWSKARTAVRAADGVAASGLYQEHPIELEPQLGLVPIGKNPQTGLWEFYHLRSAWDPFSETDPSDIEIPAHRADGSIPVEEHTGIVFVLIPGGTFWIGSQRDDPEGPNYDPGTLPGETPQLVTLGPFFIGRHELTQGQWSRLSGGKNPSYNKAGIVREGESITLCHPVETVSWRACRDLLELHGLALPTDAQWEYACRAGTTTPWWTGKKRESLIGAVNLADRATLKTPVNWNRWLELDDGYIGHAPVDAFRPNPWGLHGMHGNVREWCADPYFPHSDDHPHLPGNGERLGIGSTGRVIRGSAYSYGPAVARSAFRLPLHPTTATFFLGLRPARALQTAP